MEEILEGEVEFDNSLVPVGTLGMFDNFTANGFFDQVTDADSAKKQVNNMERLKKLMEAAEQYGQYASQYCEQEFRLFLKIAEINGAEDKLPAAKRRMVAWLRKKRQAQIDAILDQCKDGTRLHVIFNRETRGVAEAYDPAKDCERISLQILQDAESCGRTTLTRATFYEHAKHPNRITTDMAQAYAEYTKVKLRKMNALGLGDGNGTYVMPERCEKRDVAKIVETRLKSIVADLKAIREICEKTGFVIPSEGVEIIRRVASSLCRGEK
jgi:hypothetical protein